VSMEKNNSCLDLTGKVAIVTGASRGLGRAFCRALAKHGANLVCVGRDKEALEKTCALVSDCGHQALSLIADMTKPESIKRMADETVRVFGRIDVLVANAGIAGPWTRIDEETLEQWNEVVATNLTGTFLCVKAVLPSMLVQRSGSIIIISSIGALGGGPVAPASYGASKAGLIGLCKHAAVQYGNFGIRVNCILPGFHLTELGMPKDAVEREKRLNLIQQFAATAIPLARIAQPEELEGLVALLASDASAYITGATFVQDGGQTAQV